MRRRVSYPGVYVEEVSFRNTISRLDTTVTAFLGQFPDGPYNLPVQLASAAALPNIFGMGSDTTTTGRAIGQFLDNGGRHPLVVRLEGTRLAEGLGALPEAVNLLLVPDTATMSTAEASAAMVTAQDWASENHGMYILDPPRAADPKAVAQWLADTPVIRDANTALYYPWVRGADSEATPPGGIVAGVYVRTDNERGVWKAPAGAAAELRGVASFDYSVSEQEQEILNPLGINAIGQFGSSPVVWGSRTLSLDPEWKYVNVLRLGILIETSIKQGTRWAVFEPNAEPMWASVCQAAENFLHKLWRDGALAGTRPRDGYFVRIGHDTMTEDDIDNGHLNIEVGFAPLKPAEFVITRIHQWTNAARALPGRSLSRILRSTRGLRKDTPHQLVFAGPARSSKSLAAQGLAGQLGRPLLRIVLSQALSRYIGETEKNLARLLEDAAKRQTILFFDEADALSGNRTKVDSSSNRDTNPDESALLALIEAYPGIVVFGVERVHDLSKKRQIVKFNR